MLQPKEKNAEQRTLTMPVNISYDIKDRPFWTSEKLHRSDKASSTVVRSAEVYLAQNKEQERVLGLK
jgi:hypothetical protein